MTKLLEQAIAKALALPDEEQDALAIAMLSMSEGDASAYLIVGPAGKTEGELSTRGVCRSAGSGRGVESLSA